MGQTAVQINNNPYTNSTIISEHDAQASAKFHAAGICASFAMDFCKKQLATAAGNGKKMITPVTYASTARIKKIVKRQEAYEKKNSGLDRLAKSYGLTISENPIERWSTFDKEGSPSEALTAIMQRLQGDDKGCFYVSLRAEDGEGHGIAVDTLNTKFADSNVGVLQFNMPHMKSIITDCFKYLKKHGFKNCWIYKVNLKN